MAVKAVNDSAGPNGLVPTLLVFGAYPRIADESPPSLSLYARGRAVRKVMQELQQLQAKRQVTDALSMRNGPNTLPTTTLPLQSKVRVWREKKGWTGPYTLLATDNQTCTVEMPSGPTNFRSTVVKPYLYGTEEPTELPEVENPSSDSDGNGQRDDIGDNTIVVDYTARRGRGRPKGSKNRPRSILFSDPIDEALLTAKEQTDLALSAKLRRNGTITTSGKPFEASDNKEIEGLIGSGVLDIHKFDTKLHGNIHLFNS